MSRLPILPDITPAELLEINRPAQYLGGELNSVVKDEATIDFRFALCFPDTYEVGMSHLGMQILYHVMNSNESTWAERAFMPFPDMEKVLRQKNAPLRSLEGKRPLSEFDAVGFSLQYELCGTNILAMLDLGGIPRYARDRGPNQPIVIGGGPYCYHPDALADFFDVFFLGDAEEAIGEIISTIRANRHRSRAEQLAALDTLEGVYVPSLFAVERDESGCVQSITSHSSKQQVVRRLLPTMEGAPYPTRPIVPNIKAVHNRLSVEVMRGCVRGCRFCQAGYLYRPQRERPPEEITKIIREALPQTGFEELSLLSLSTADYCSVVPLLKSLMDRYGDGDRLAISFPSTRVDALTPEVLEQVQRVRRTNFTVAPEGGTQRIRDVINKGVADEQILETCRNVFRMGWSGIKLYFMIGLPTETDEDVLGIAEIAERIKSLPEARNKDITVSVSSFVPKPHTPFQWSAQITPEEIIRKQRMLSERLHKRRINFRYHDAFSSLLEGIFCRGGRELSALIDRAYELGCRLDAWTEEINEELWLQAFTDTGIDPAWYLRERSTDEQLPWDHLNCGISKDYFLKEYRRALRDHVTPDCLTKSCSICGACNYDTKRNVLWPREQSEQRLQVHASQPAPRPLLDASHRYRVSYEKRGAQRFVGHLEHAQVIQRACRRAEIPLAYSQGFHPMARISFGPPLQLGLESRSELADIFVTEEMPADVLRERLSSALPDDVAITSVTEMPLRGPSLQHELEGFEYEVQWHQAPKGVFQGIDAEESAAARASRLSNSIHETVIVRPKSPKPGRSGGSGGNKRGKPESASFALRQCIVSVREIIPSEELPLGGFTFRYKLDPTTAQARPIELVAALSGLKLGEFSIEKTAAFFKPAPSAPMTHAVRREEQVSAV